LEGFARELVRYAPPELRKVRSLTVAKPAQGKPELSPSPMISKLDTRELRGEVSQTLMIGFEVEKAQSFLILSFVLQGLKFAWPD